MYRKLISLCMSLVLTMSMLCMVNVNAYAKDVNKFYVSESGTGNGKQGNPSSLEYALNNYESGDIIYLDNGKYNLSDKVELVKPVSIIGESKEETVITLKGNSYGFRIGKGEKGIYSFEGLTLTSDSALSLISIQAYSEENRATASVRNCMLVNTKKTAIDFEGTSYPGPDKSNFDLTVESSFIEANAYGIGSGLDNNSPDVSASTIKVNDTAFNSISNSGSIYCIHAPNALKSLTVDKCSFSSAKSGGIKYIFSPSNENAVKITNNSFADVNRNGGNSYAIMVTNKITDLKDNYSYCWASELSGNDLSNQNVLILPMAKLEVLWFPDGQAVNSTQYNNLNQSNITNEGTRYTCSAWGSFNKTGALLTDFNIAEEKIEFEGPQAQPKEISYIYNGSTSGVYSNFSLADDYFTIENPIHCSTPITYFNRADSITRWSIDDESIARLAIDKERNLIKSRNGKISIEPVSYGTTYATATVGAGKDGTLPNAKSDRVKIAVKAPVVYHSNYPVDGVENTKYQHGSYEVGTMYEAIDSTNMGFSLNGYKFMGWSEEENGKVKYAAGDKLEIPAAVTELYGVWKKKATYTVTVNYLTEDGESLYNPYASSGEEGSQYDVNEASRDFEDYEYVRADGDALAGNLDGNKIINLYYRSKTVTIEDEDVPLIPGEGKSDKDDEGEIVTIEDEDVPLTGDSSNALVWAISAAAAMIMVAIILRKGLKKAA